MDCPENEPLPYGIIDPDYARIYTKARIIAWQYGFCISLHGSFTRDLDLLMAPWQDTARNDLILPVVSRIAEVTGTRLVDQGMDKPHGRKAFCLMLPDNIRWVDLSTLPCTDKPTS